jgi:hypothetical protein
MRLVALGLAGLILSGSLAAQMPPQTGSSGMQIQPFRLDSTALKGLLGECQSTTLAGAEQEIRKKTQKAFLAGTVAAVVEFLSAGEGPEGRAVSEFFPILAAKLRVPAALGLLGSTEMQIYQGRGYRLTDTFEVCSPTVGLPDLTVVLPVTPSVKSAEANAADQLQPMPTLSVDALRSLRWLQPQDSTLPEPVKLPTCDLPNPFARPNFATVMAAKLSGTVLDLSSGKALASGATGPQPAQGARVDLIGPTPASCVTSSGGEFSFRSLLAGSYSLQVSQFLRQSSTTSLTLQPGQAQDLTVRLTLLP